MNANLIHDIIFYVMYAALTIAVVILIERGLYFLWAGRLALRFAKVLTPDVRSLSDLPPELTVRNSLPLSIIRPVLEKKHITGDREAMNDLIDAQYLLSKPQMSRGLWILETVVTAAPLLGLLGTILGIVDTFKALSASGNSDASMVSAGMGTALYATGLGIAIALLCLVGNNYLQSRMERINELLKVLLIRAGSPLSRPEKAANHWEEREEQRYA